MALDQDWGQGYITDIAYIEGFFRELSPVWLNYVAALKGSYPRKLDQKFTYLELGCGLGQSLATFAGAFPQSEFYGVDFNPAHIDAAQRYAAIAGITNAHYIERSFQTLHEVALPEFDFIVLHGIYSWINPDAQAAIQKIIFDKLKPGGLVYNSYNCFPGWAVPYPLRRLLVELSSAEDGDSAERLLKALQNAQTLAQVKSGYFQAVPQSADILKDLGNRSRNYLAHEYLNANWDINYSLDIADQMRAAKLDFLGSATLLDNHPELQLPPAALQLMEKQPTPRLRQLYFDYLTNQRFRRDIFVRGHSRLPRHLQSLVFRDVFVGTHKQAKNLKQKIRLGRGELSIDEKIFPILQDLLNEGSFRIGDLVQSVQKRTGQVVDAERAIMMLLAAGELLPFAEAAKMPKPVGTLQKVKLKLAANQAIAAHSWATVTRKVFICPRTGSGITFEPLEALLLSLVISGRTKPEQLIQNLIQECKARGIKLEIREAQKPPLAKAEDGKEKAAAAQAEKAPPSKAEQEAVTNRAAEQMVETFLNKTLPTWHRLGIVDLA